MNTTLLLPLLLVPALSAPAEAQQPSTVMAWSYSNELLFITNIENYHEGPFLIDRKLYKGIEVYGVRAGDDTEDPRWWLITTLSFYDWFCTY